MVMKIKSLKNFSGVRKGTTGEAVRETDGIPGQWRITWDLDRTKPLIDWFSQWEFENYLEEVK